jgi:hypothetical protein
MRHADSLGQRLNAGRAGIVVLVLALILICFGTLIAALVLEARLARGAEPTLDYDPETRPR